MIELIMRLANEYVFIRVQGTNVVFGNSTQGKYVAPIENLRLSDAGIIKEFPELKHNPERKKIAVERFKKRIKELPNEKERAKYVVKDLKKHGYELFKVQQQGMRATNEI